MQFPRVHNELYGNRILQESCVEATICVRECVCVSSILWSAWCCIKIPFNTRTYLPIAVFLTHTLLTFPKCKLVFFSVATLEHKFILRHMSPLNNCKQIGELCLELNAWHFSSVSWRVSHFN